MMKLPVKTLLAFFALAGTMPAASMAGTHAESSHAANPMTAAAETKLSEGEVRKVDKAAGKLTIKHGPLENLGMPPMTMIFRVKEAAMLDQVKPGKRIRFLAGKGERRLHRDQTRSGRAVTNAGRAWMKQARRTRAQFPIRPFRKTDRETRR